MELFGIVFSIPVAFVWVSSLKVSEEPAAPGGGPRALGSEARR